MNTCAVQRVETLQAADHICIWDKTRWPFRYTHHGVVYTPGKTTDEIIIAHVWSPINGFRESQADSSFRLTTLTEFLNARPIADMRRVQYHSSLLADAFSQLGEVHRARSDIPPVVLARCEFLLGLGKGHFSILSLNCEHVALWCKTGVVWSKQLFHRSSARAPYVSQDKATAQRLVAPLEARLQRLRQDCLDQNQQLRRLVGRRVYLRVAETKFVKRFGPQLHVVHNDPTSPDMAFRQAPTAFHVQVELCAYNNVKVILTDAETGEYVGAKAHCIKLLTRRAYHRDSVFKFEYTWNGELQSRRHRRWFVGAQTRDGLLRTFNTRDRATRFTIVDADEVDQSSVAVDPAVLLSNDEPLQGVPKPPPSGEIELIKPMSATTTTTTTLTAMDHAFQVKVGGAALDPAITIVNPARG